MKIIAHRGGAGLGPENTLSCIEKGLGCKHTSMIEIDVHLTKDGQVVVMHDPDVDRMTNGSGKIEDMTLAELKALRIAEAGAAGSKVADAERIPTLEEVLQLIGNRAEVLLEIKIPDDRDDGLEKACLDIIKAAGAYGRVTVQSFNDIVLDRFHKLDPAIRLEKLLFVRPFNLRKIAQQKHIRSYNIYRRGLVTPRFVSRMHALGKEVKVWTLQSPEQYHARNLDGVITDRPDLF